MLKNRGIAFKFNLLILSSVAIVFGSIFSYTYFYVRDLLLDKIEKEAMHIVGATATLIDKRLTSAQQVPRSLAFTIEHMTPDTAALIDLLKDLISDNEEVFGSAVAYEPYAYDPDKRLFAPYCYRQQTDLAWLYLPYDYLSSDWYRLPKENGRAIWTEPYYDEGAGEILMSTFSVPFFLRTGQQRQLSGIVTADIALDWLRTVVSAMEIPRGGFGFLITKNGTFVSHPDSRWVMNETIFSVAEAQQDQALREIGRRMIRGETGFVAVTSLMDEDGGWMAFTPLSSSGWSMGVVFPKAELMADIVGLHQVIVAIGLVGLLLIMALILLISISITRPLRALTTTAEEIATGNLDAEMSLARSNDEVGRLALAFDEMKVALKDHIRELTATTAAKERIESELKIAHNIQMGILPKVFPPFPNRSEFDLYATIVPAREVGGDLYDFFLVGDDHLCITTGDVSGKGVAAALFMAISQTLIKTKANQGLSVADVLDRLNEDLSMDNPSMMFVTLFLALLNIRTGEMTYCNGGHNPPYLIRNGGAIEPLETTGGMALGVDESFCYQAKQVLLAPGDALFLFTDGITEAMNADRELFAEARLENLLEALRQRPLEQIVAGVLKAVEAFADGTPQADDITMLMLKYSGPDTQSKT